MAWAEDMYVPSSKEKKYAHYLGVASWAGARIIQGTMLFYLVLRRF
jgi:hypothetical protein